MPKDSVFGLREYFCNLAATLSVSFAPVDSISRSAYPTGWSYLGEHFVVFFLLINLVALVVAGNIFASRSFLSRFPGWVITVLLVDIVTSVYFLFVLPAFGVPAVVWYKASATEYLLRRIFVILAVGTAISAFESYRSKNKLIR